METEGKGEEKIRKEERWRRKRDRGGGEDRIGRQRRKRDRGGRETEEEERQRRKRDRGAGEDKEKERT